MRVWEVRRWEVRRREVRVWEREGRKEWKKERGRVNEIALNGGSTEV